MEAFCLFVIKLTNACLIQAMEISEGYPIKMGPAVVTYFLH